MDIESLLTLQEFADLVGVKYHTMVTYKAKGKLPDPDAKVGNSPLWKRSTAKAFVKAGAGRGQGWRKGQTGAHASQVAE